jgi:hypothetical protein
MVEGLEHSERVEMKDWLIERGDHFISFDGRLNIIVEGNRYVPTDSSESIGKIIIEMLSIDNVRLTNIDGDDIRKVDSLAVEKIAAKLIESKLI